MQIQMYHKNNDLINRHKLITKNLRIFKLLKDTLRIMLKNYKYMKVSTQTKQYPFLQKI